YTFPAHNRLGSWDGLKFLVDLAPFSQELKRLT
ncbi:MAG: hypothetical protein RIQ73_430, partial [Actinomycetota bacterium]